MPGLLKILKRVEARPTLRRFTVSCVACDEVFKGEAESLPKLMEHLDLEGWGIVDLSSKDNLGGTGLCAVCTRPTP